MAPIKKSPRFPFEFTPFLLLVSRQSFCVVEFSQKEEKGGSHAQPVVPGNQVMRKSPWAMVEFPRIPRRALKSASTLGRL